MKQRKNWSLFAVFLFIAAFFIGLAAYLLHEGPPQPRAVPDPNPPAIAPSFPDAAAEIAALPDSGPSGSGGAEVAEQEPPKVAMLQPRSQNASRTIRIKDNESEKSKHPEPAPDGGDEPDAGSEPPDSGIFPDAEVAQAPPEEKIAPVEKAPVELFYREELPWLKTTSIIVVIDGQSVAKVESEKGMEQDKTVRLYVGPLPIGTHKMNLKITYIGDSNVFSYLEGYTFTLKHGMVFATERGKTTRATIVASPRGNITQEWKDRVALRVDVE